MKLHINPDKELVAIIREKLKLNEGYCPCVFESRGKPEYRCICENFRNHTPVGETCHCGLYIKDEQ